MNRSVCFFCFLFPVFLCSLAAVSVLPSLRLAAGEDPYAEKRKAMVERDLKGRGIKDTKVLDVMGRIPRHLFVPGPQREKAYADHPLPIGEGQTISQPYVVALMSELLKLKKDDRVLEIGAGSGYQAAVI